MKALISPNESFTWTWISSWEWISATNEVPGGYTPVMSNIYDCQRIAQVEPDNKVFGVALPLHWVDCPNDCIQDEWYFKDDVCKPKPQNAPIPPAPVEVLP